MPVPTTGFGMVGTRNLICEDYVRGTRPARGKKSRRIWYGWHKEHWTKGATGTGLGVQQVVARHW